MSRKDLMKNNFKGHRILVKCLELTLALQDVEPIFASMALYDARFVLKRDWSIDRWGLLFGVVQCQSSKSALTSEVSYILKSSIPIWNSWIRALSFLSTDSVILDRKFFLIALFGKPFFYEEILTSQHTVQYMHWGCCKIMIVPAIVVDLFLVVTA